ncbi:hypothetical protein IV38_GL001956 [Lactobacillus selangorensis]|uniref:ATP-dependent Clp protease proteolytic subunit n=1 Tax=Lactobacillus selangorensis TaxID=81857 RepID=A0A0R2FV71_9LACO|nr:head maturation protease, ClpP-related [Lactobacillus selangorensis]KRN27742.1 hypothetical protein IV38_GL001956 [Lactobacillus selangorensis]KRN30293.1 hypothetical protein IV40_GL001881 [Lactobacillus selangorensis]
MGEQEVIDVTAEIVDNDTGFFYDYFGIGAVYPSKIKQQLQNANGQDVTVNVASPGGDVFAASEIYSAIRGYQGHVTVNIQGMAASAASVIAMAGDTVNIAPTAMIMIHNAQTIAQGDYNAFDKTSDMIKKVNGSIVNAYVAKTGMSDTDLLNMMNRETWMTAQEAVDNHFADAIMFENSKAPQFINSAAPILSRDGLDKFKSLLKNSAVPQANNPELQTDEPEPQNTEQPASSNLQKKLAILMHKK